MSTSINSISNFSDVKSYLDGFINYEKKTNYPYAKTLKLKRMEHLLGSLGINYKKNKDIHVAGTKGKGSTACFCANCLAEAGYKTGLYTSPHFFDFRERIKILTRGSHAVVGSLISKRDVTRLVKEMQPRLEKIRYTSALGALSFFEVYTALAFKYFLEKKIDFAVLETGLGGRLDATNVTVPLVSIITHIGYDHMDKLGKTLSSIAKEKAGIIKRNVDVVCARQAPSVHRVISERARKMNAELFTFGAAFRSANEHLGLRHTAFDFCFGSENVCGAKIFLKGKYQIENASLAMASIFRLKEKGVMRGSVNFKKALAGSYLPGRFEILKNNPRIISDIAHNEPSFRALSQNLKTYYPKKKIILIFAASNDKDIKKMLSRISYKHLIVTSFNNPRSFRPQEIKNICRVKKVYLAEDVKKALEIGKQLYDNGSVIVISGSLFLVSEARRALQRAGKR